VITTGNVWTQFDVYGSDFVRTKWRTAGEAGDSRTTEVESIVRFSDVVDQQEKLVETISTLQAENKQLKTLIGGLRKAHCDRFSDAELCAQ
jgi:hypothetical protein